jgi:ubiquinone/menaquinone biosynthesis C-methylase UbiE
MGYAIDPEGNELRVLHELINFRDKDVVEVGCGEGRMTWRYADRSRSVLALDPDRDRIQTAITSTPADLKAKVTWQVADIGRVTLPAAGFDVAILSWSL